MLRLRRRILTQVAPLGVRVGTDERRAWADEGLVGEVREGDEVIVNAAALASGDALAAALAELVS